MAINTSRKSTRNVLLPTLRGTTDLSNWSERLLFAIRKFFGDVDFNIEQGTSQFQITDTVPTTDDIEEGGIVFYDSGSVRRLYTKLNGTLRYATLT